MTKAALFSALYGIHLVSAGSAQAETLEDYLASMDRTPVTFSGKIYYSDEDFRFRSNSGDFFGASIDAGRDVREDIEEGCLQSSFMFTSDDLCSITGSGSVEIRGSDIFLSISEVEELEVPSK